MAKFSHHESCPRCGSKDNVMAYSDGFKRCNTPNCSFIVHSRNYTPQETVKSDCNFFYGEYPTVLEQVRNLNHQTIREYRVTLRTKDGTTTFLSYPHFYKGKVVGCKNRYVASGSINLYPRKEFTVEGTITDSLFGYHLFEPNSDKPVLIAEGEDDSMAAYQMLDGEYQCLSIPLGAKSAKNTLVKYKEIFKDHKVYICFDNDLDGQTATDECMQIFPNGQAYRVILPEDYKDASDMLAANEIEEFKTAVARAKPIIPSSYVSFEQLKTDTLDYIFNISNKYDALSTGFPGLDKAMRGGLNLGEMVFLFAGTGKGKTQFTLNIVYNIIKQGHSVFYVPLEMKPTEIATRLLEIELGTQIMALEDADRVKSLDMEVCSKALDKFENKLHVNRHIGSYSIDELSDLIRFHTTCSNTKLIVIDHIHNVANKTVESSMHEHLDQIAGFLKKAASDYNCCVWVVGQMNRDGKDRLDNDPTLSRIRGSHGIAQNSDAIFALRRSTYKAAKGKDELDTDVVLETVKMRKKSIGESLVFSFDETTMRYKEGLKASEAF